MWTITFLIGVFVTTWGLLYGDKIDVAIGINMTLMSVAMIESIYIDFLDNDND